MVSPGVRRSSSGSSATPDATRSTGSKTTRDRPSPSSAATRPRTSDPCPSPMPMNAASSGSRRLGSSSGSRSIHADPSVEGLHEVADDMPREPRLADAARSDERDQPRTGGDQSLDGLELTVAADHPRRQRRGEGGGPAGRDGPFGGLGQAGGVPGFGRIGVFGSGRAVGDGSAGMVPANRREAPRVSLPLGPVVRSGPASDPGAAVRPRWRTEGAAIALRTPAVSRRVPRGPARTPGTGTACRG